MSEKRIFRLAHREARRRAMACVADAPDGYIVTVQEAKRSLDQNAMLWPLLQAFSEQLPWVVNGKQERLMPEEWKDVLTASLRGEALRMAPGLNGGMVILGERTSKMGKTRFSELLDFIQAEAAARGVDINEREEA